jgi:hypothetical protein
MATVFTPTNTPASTDSNTNTSFRVRCTLSGASNGQIRVTFRAGTGGSMVLTAASIGKYSGSASEMTTAPVTLLFGGSGASGTITAGNSVTSDFVTHSGSFSLASSDVLLVVFDLGASNANTGFSTSNSNCSLRFLPGASATTQNPVSGTDLAGTNYAIVTVETNDPAGKAIPIFSRPARFISRRF